jgi:uncharacterized protein YukE
LSPSTFSPVVHRALLAVALFTFASWVLIVGALLVWTPGRGMAAGALSRMARAASAAPDAAPLAAAAISDLALPCATGSSYYVEAEPDSQGFSWGLLGGDGDVWIDDSFGERRSFNGRSGAPLFWFRDHGSEFMVTDPAIVAEVREAAAPLREASRELGAVGREMGRNGARVGRLGGRLGAMSARMAMIEARMARDDVSSADRDELEARLRELRSEMAELRAEMERERFAHDDAQEALSHRMSELSAHHREVLRSVREKVRAIAARAQREGKAERPHANA